MPSHRGMPVRQWNFHEVSHNQILKCFRVNQGSRQPSSGGDKLSCT
jgi:hypothetical protein